jgi:hypothetical protein
MLGDDALPWYIHGSMSARPVAEQIWKYHCFLRKNIPVRKWKTHGFGHEYLDEKDDGKVEKVLEQMEHREVVRV